jgi:hypothetical protein
LPETIETKLRSRPMKFSFFTIKRKKTSNALFYGHLSFVGETHEGEAAIAFLFGVFFTSFFYAEGQREKDETYTEYEAPPQKDIQVEKSIPDCSLKITNSPNLRRRLDK